MTHFLSLCPPPSRISDAHESLKHFLSKGQRGVEPTSLSGSWDSAFPFTIPSTSPAHWSSSWNPIAAPAVVTVAFLFLGTGLSDFFSEPQCRIHLKATPTLLWGVGKVCICQDEQAQTQSF